MKSLTWKQWRESRFLLFIFIAWMILAVCYAIGYEVGHADRAVVGSFSGLAMLYTIVAAVILAVRTSRGEQTEGTFSFTASLPISMRRIATVRILGAVATLVIPVLIAACILSLVLAIGLVEQVEPRVLDGYLQLPERATASLPTALEQLWSVTAISALGGTELLLILCLAGCWLRSQSQVGLLGAALALGSMVAADIFWYGTRHPYSQLIYGAVLPQSLVVHWGYGDETGSYTDHELAQHRWYALALALPLLSILTRLFVTQYGSLSDWGHVVKRRRFRFAMPALASHLPIRLPNRLSALVWLELRQSVPLAIYGLIIAILITVAGVLMEHRSEHDFGTSLRAELPHSVFFTGMLWAVVVGSGLYSTDLGPKLGGFWRSRPISPQMWFWCKFFVGLTVVLMVLDGTTILISWNAPRESMTAGMSWAYIACFPVLHAMLYSLAVLGTCAFRRPVMGGVLAIVFYTIVTAVITAFPATLHLEPINIYNALLSTERGGRVGFLQHSYPFVYGAIAISVFAFAQLAFQFAKPLQPSYRGFTPDA